MSVDIVSAVLLKQARNASRIALYLDFDGTLSPTVLRHEDACLPEETRDVLTQLTSNPSFFVALVTGRSIADIRRRAEISNLTYAGNHGLEIEGPGISFRVPAAAQCEAHLAQAVARIRQLLSGLEGAEVEAKGLTASVHFRRVNPAQHEHILQTVRTLIPENDPQLILRDAKMVIEIRPRVHWNKGEAVLWLRRELGLQSALEIYMGDDTTDEDAFQLLSDAFTVHVGNGPTAARFSVPGTEDVAVLLKCLLNTKGSL